MAVITELIEAGSRLKQAGNLQGAIEHFKQLHATYPANTRIMFELATCWRAFGVPEQALPLYRELLAAPKGQGLPPKDIPRLYTQLGATLLELDEEAESLAIIEEGLRLHPSYRSLRAWRIFALDYAGSHQTALVDALELMLESLAPSRWDIFEADIKTKVKALRAELPEHERGTGAETVSDAPAKPPAETDLRSGSIPTGLAGEDERASQRSEIAISSDAPGAEETELTVNLVAPRKRKKTRRKSKSSAQLGKTSVRINISGERDEPARATNDEDEDAADASLNIPIDPD
jgi:tetratricopeptide (TPR) repeat protein